LVVKGISAQPSLAIRRAFDSSSPAFLFSTLQARLFTDYLLTYLLRLAISPWLHARGAAVWHLPSILRNPDPLSGVDDPSHLTRALIAGTDCIHEQTKADKQRRSAIIISTTVICHVNSRV